MTKHFLSHLVLGASALWATAAMGAVNPIVIDNGATLAWENADVAADSAGNLHIAVLGVDATTMADADHEVYYFRVSPSGSVLDGPIQVSTTDTNREGRPRIVVTSNRKAVIVWRSYSSEAIRAALINPGAAAGSEVEIAETTVGTTTSSVYEPFAAIDRDDQVHAFFSTWGTIRHIRFAAADLDETDVTTGVVEHDTGISARGYPGGEAVADANGDLHLVFSNSAASDQAAYAMLDNDGAVLIGSTNLYDGTEPSGPNDGRHFSIWANSGGTIGIVYGDNRFTELYAGEGGESFYVRLDPSLDDQNGNAATMSAIRVGTEVKVSGDFYNKAFRGSDGLIHILSGTNPRGYGQLAYRAFNASGTMKEHNIVSNTFNAAATTDYRTYVKGARGSVFWTQSVYSPTLVGYTTQLVMAKVSSLKGGGGGGGGSIDLTLLVGLGLMALRRRSRARAA